jgi:hypothetical protein
MRSRKGALVVVVLALSTLPLDAQTKPYTPKNGVLNWKAVVFGGAFRVTTVVPLHGDFAHFDRVEIVEAESLIGSDVPPAVLHDLTEHLVEGFRAGGHFSEVGIVRAYEPHQARPAAGETTEDFRGSDSLDAPIRPAADMAVMDLARRLAADDSAGDTLVVTAQVLDYAKGNKFLQLLLLNLGNGLMTLRMAYYDKATGEELGRSVISSDNSSKVVPSLLSSRTPITGIAEGLVDQVTRRKVAAER